MALLVVLGALAANCASSDEMPTPDGKPLQTEPDIIGNITDVQQVGKNGVVGTILVEAKVTTADGEYTDRYMVTVRDETLILEQDGEIVDHVSFEVLQAGQQARIWFSGPVRESYPAQVDAQQIMVAGSRNDREVNLGQEFSLSIGQSASIAGEDFEIRFEEVVKDSRCPKNATCVWAGRVSCIVELTDGYSSYRMALTEPGLTDQYAEETYEEYQLTFHVRPYPEVGKEISADQYRLLLIVSK